MGVYALGRCYDSESDAYNALFSSVVPSFNQGCLNSLSKDGSQWSVVVQCDGSSDSFNVTTLPLVSCNPADSVADGLTLGFAVVSVWIAAYVLKVLTRAL